MTILMYSTVNQLASELKYIWKVLFKKKKPSGHRLFLCCTYVYIKTLKQ